MITYLGLEPDNDTARQWLRDELSKPRYSPEPTKAPKSTHNEPGFLDRLGKWIADLFNSDLSKILGLILLVLLIAGAVYVVYRVRRETRSSGANAEAPEPGAVLGGVTGTADQFRESAQAALAAGDFDAAVLAAMRAIAQTASDRTLLLGARSATAHDIGRRLRHVFPAHYPSLYRAADVFDAVAYGGRHTDAASASALVALDTELREAKPSGYVDDEVAEMSLPLLPPVSR
ncbi:DUF4129 domain-containing protein [Gordonia crocea]|uniref:Protein-glutamine gamma-glutamyltransferase-like C-terminal domain-containing protein n=1 Tax=Gordonia crocea TaxID=589162 RepID=A0A7M3SU06_9ACTN|nr:DUF4129 domain-containing protein [Gordonia crocea]GED96130.1 hypothetical protein nbrc107697_01690 [Gordonia crocea]